MDKLKKLAEAMRELVGSEFSGYIRINFSQGSLGRVEKFEELDEVALAVQDSGAANPKKKKEEKVGQDEKGRVSVASRISRSNSAILLFILLLSPSIGSADPELALALTPAVSMCACRADINYFLRADNGAALAAHN